MDGEPLLSIKETLEIGMTHAERELIVVFSMVQLTYRTGIRRF